MKYKGEFSEAHNNWEVERLFHDLEAFGESLSPTAERFLLGILCGNRPIDIAENLNKSSDIIQQTLLKEIYPAIENLVNSESKINWRSAPQLLEKEYRKKPQSSPPTSTDIQIDWRGVCTTILEKQQATKQLRHKTTVTGCEVEVLVALGLVVSASYNNVVSVWRDRKTRGEGICYPHLRT